MLALHGRKLWLFAAWSVVLGAPAAATAFVWSSLPTLDCQPRRTCLQQTVEQAWTMLTLRFGGLLVLCGGLWWASLWMTPPERRRAAILKGGAYSLALSALATHTLRIGMNAVIEARTEVSLSLIVNALASIVVACAFWWPLSRADLPR